MELERFISIRRADCSLPISQTYTKIILCEKQLHSCAKLNGAAITQSETKAEKNIINIH